MYDQQRLTALHLLSIALHKLHYVQGIIYMQYVCTVVLLLHMITTTYCMFTEDNEEKKESM